MAVRFRDHLRRMWKLYLVGAVALALLNHWVYTMTRPLYTEAETLKIVLLNVEVELDEAKLAEEARPLGFKTVEVMPLYLDFEDPQSDMLLKIQLVSGFGDIYISDEAGLEKLRQMEVCQSERESLDGLYLIEMRSGTDNTGAREALDILEEEMGEEQK